MATPIAQAKPPLRAVDPALETNSTTVAEARNKLNELLARLRAEHEADILKLAGSTVTSADVATFRFDDFTAKWLQIKERFERNRDAILTFQRDLQSATDQYMAINKPDLIEFYNKQIETEKQQLANQTKADKAIEARIGRFENLIAKLQNYGTEQTSQTGQYRTRKGAQQTGSQTQQTQQHKGAAKKRTRKRRPKKQTTSQTKPPRAQQTTKLAGTTKKTSKRSRKIGQKSAKKSTKKAAKK
jgi:hypothetical protein